MKKLAIAIMKNRVKLEELISNNADYSEILKQSQNLDELISEEMKNQLAKESKK